MNKMHKLLTKILSFALVMFLCPISAVNANETELTIQELKDRLLSYGMYTIISDGSNELVEDISDLPYEQLHAEIEKDIIDKLNETDQIIIWDPTFVLELAPIEFPDLYPVLYEKLMEQGYSPENEIIAEVNFTPNQTLKGIVMDEGYSTNATTYTKTLEYNYVASGYGTVITSKSTMSWTYSSSVYTLSGFKAEKGDGGWLMLNMTARAVNNKTADAYGFFTYYAVKDAYSYSAYLQLKMVPYSNGTAKLTVLSSGINAIGIGF